MMFRNKAVNNFDNMPLAQSLSLQLEKVCDDYIQRWFKTHKAAALTIKQLLKEFNEHYASKPEHFKEMYLTFLIAALSQYLQREKSTTFLEALNKLCNQDPFKHLLNQQALESHAEIYPVSLLAKHLLHKGEPVSDVWSTQGGIEHFVTAYDHIYPPYKIGYVLNK